MHAAGDIEAFVFESAQRENGELNIGIFMDRLQTNSSLEIHDPEETFQRIHLRG